MFCHIYYIKILSIISDIFLTENIHKNTKFKNRKSPAGGFRCN